MADQEAAEAPHASDAEVIPDRAPLLAFLYPLRKAHREITGAQKARERYGQVVTRGHARAYVEELLPGLLEERRRRHHRK